MESIIIIVHVLAAIGITGLVLIQQGKGAEAGASFGGGASQTMFGSVGSGNALTKSTSWLAIIFFATSLTLAVYARNQADRGIETSSLVQNAEQVQQAPGAGGSGDLPQVPGAAAADDLPQTPDQSALQQVQEEFGAFVEENADELSAEAKAAADAAAAEQQ